jgi:hypothetical protein
MTNTTQDQLKEKCPAISSHMQSRLDETSATVTSLHHLPHHQHKPDQNFGSDHAESQGEMVEEKACFSELTPCTSSSSSSTLETLELAKNCAALENAAPPPGSLSPQSSQDSFLSQDLCPLEPTTTICGPIEPVIIQAEGENGSEACDPAPHKKLKIDSTVEASREDEGLSVSSSPTSSSSSLVSSSSSSLSTCNNSLQSNDEAATPNFGEIIKTSIVETVSA